MKKFFVMLLAGLMVCGASAQEDDAAVTHRILVDTIDQGTALLKNEALDFEQKMDAFEVLLRDCCHMELMAYTVLGGGRWKQMTDEQRSEFISAFIQMVTRSYYSKLDMADVSSVEFTYGENEAAGPSRRILKTVVADADNSYSVDYKFAKIKGEWWVRDLVIEGVSLIASYRSEYSDYLQTHTIDDLISMLKEKAAEAKAEAEAKRMNAELGGADDAVTVALDAANSVRK